MTSAGARIRQKRIELGYSQAQLALLAGISQSALAELESGESKLPSSGKLVGLSKALGVSKLWIINGQEGAAEIASQEDQDLLDKINKLTAEQRRAVYSVIQSMQPNGDKS